MGRFIAIEGGDGSGKATQAKLLAEYARGLGYDVLEISFPRYGHDSAYYVEQYLNGKYGSNNDVPAELGTLPYALDRFAAKNEIDIHLKKDHSLVIADRYVASNLAHQGTKVSNVDERREFYRRTMLTEYEVLGIPRPDLNIVLLLPAEISQANVDKKAERTYTKMKRDILEADVTHLDKAKHNYEEICEIFPDNFTAVTCTDDEGNQLDIDTIQKSVRTKIPTDWLDAN